MLNQISGVLVDGDTSGLVKFLEVSAATQGPTVRELVILSVQFVLNGHTKIYNKTLLSLSQP